MPTAALQTLFPSLPFDRSFQPQGCPRAIRVLGVDSDSMVSPFGADRLFARGRCTDQFDQLDQKLNAAPGDAGNEVRVLLLHHSPSHEPWIGRLSSASRARFVRFVRDHDIRVVLTGHTHEPLVNTLDDMGLPDVLEACCGTTTQRTVLPPGVHAPFRQGHLATTNTLVWHELLEDGRNLTWRSRVYPRHPVHGFGWAPMPDGSSRQGSVAL